MSIRCNSCLMVILAVLGMAIIAPPAHAQSAEALGSFRDWDAFKLVRSGETTCYAVAEPTQMAPKGVKRGKVFFTVSNWPQRNSRGEPSIITGYDYRPASKATVTIGQSKFEFFTEKDAAWLADTKDEKRLITAMRSGSTMVVKGTSSRGTVTTDRYSLLGISAALDKINAACK